MNINSYNPKVKMSAKLPGGDANGLNTPQALDALTRGYTDEVEHVAVVVLKVGEQHLRTSGVLMNVATIERIELVSDHQKVAEIREVIARETAARGGETLPVFGDELPQIDTYTTEPGSDENIEGRG